MASIHRGEGGAVGDQEKSLIIIRSYQSVVGLIGIMEKTDRADRVEGIWNCSTTDLHPLN